MSNTTPIEIELRGIAKLKQQLKEIKDEMAETSDLTRKAFLADEAGAIQQKLKGINSEIEKFGKGSNVDQLKNSFEEFQHSLYSLDFAAAGKKAANFSQALKGIDASVITNQFKGMGNILKSLGSAFISFGKILLTNPIFLIAGVIAAVVGAIVLLLNKLGLLKPILQAIGKVFGWIKDAIDAVVQSIKDFLDWLGLTTYAADEMAQANIDAAQKTQAAYKEQSNSVIDGLDREIRVRQAAGKDTYDLEKQKQKVIAETAIQTLWALRDEMIARAKLGNITKEEIKAMQDKVAEQKKILRNANTEIQVLEAGHTKKMVEEAAKRAEARKAAIEKEKEAELKAWEERKKLEEDMVNNTKLATKQLNKVNAEALKEQSDKYNEMQTAFKESLMKNAQEALERQKAFNEARLNLGGDLVKGLQGLDNLLQAAGVKTAGLQKTIALVQIATDTAKAISATIAGAAAAAAAGGPAAPFLLAGYIASGIGTILSAVASAWSALKKAPPVGGSVSGGAPSAPSASTTAATPNVSLFGQNNDANNLTSAQSVESNQNIVVQAVVSETDMTATQNKVKKIQQNATL